MKHIPAYQVSTGPFKAQILKEFEEVMDSGMLILGEKTRRFEEVFASSHQRKYGIAVNSDTSALEAALCLLNRHATQIHDLKGKVVIMPDTAFYGCANVVIRLNGKVVPAPVTISNGIMPTLEQIQQTVAWCRDQNLDIIAYMAVYTAGMVGADAIEAIKWCQDEDIPVIEDCAHCHGALYSDGKLVGHYGDITTFSFYATKMIHSGEGGMVLVDDPEWNDWLRTYRNYGKATGPDQDPVFADMSIVGYNWRMTEFQAALGRILWENVGKIYKARQVAELEYDKWFHPKTGAVAAAERLIVFNEQARPNLYRYIILCPLMKSDTKNWLVFHDLEAKGISLQAKCNSKPLTHFKALEATGRMVIPDFTHESREASGYCMTHLCLPIYPSLLEKDAAYVASKVTQSLGKLK